MNKNRAKYTVGQAMDESFAANIDAEWDKILHSGSDFFPVSHPKPRWQPDLKQGMATGILYSKSASSSTAADNKGPPHRQNDDLYFSTVKANSRGIEQLNGLKISIQDLFNNAKRQFLEYESKYDTVITELVSKKSTLAGLDLRKSTLIDENTAIQQAIEKRIEDENSKLHKDPYKELPKNQNYGSSVDKNFNKDLRREVLRNSVDAVVDDSTLTEEIRPSHAQLLIRKITQRMRIFGELIKIQNRFGGVVAAYFSFIEAFFVIFGVLFLVSLILSILHIIKLSRSGDVDNVIFGPGILPGFMYFSTFSDSEGGRYSVVVLVMQVLLLYTVYTSAVQHDAEVKYQEDIEANEKKIHSKFILMAWDNAAIHHLDVDSHFMSVYHRSKELINTLFSKEAAVKPKSRLAQLTLVFRKIIGSLWYLVIQFLCYLFISYTITSFQNTTSSVLSPIIPPMITSIFNNIFPYFLRVINNFERWENNRTAIIVKICRYYLSTSLNILILAISSGLVLDPFLLSKQNEYIIRTKLEPNFNSEYNCRFNQTGDYLVIYILVDLFVHSLFHLLMPYILQKLQKNSWSKSEFDLVVQTISFVYFIGFIVLIVPIVPLAFVFVPIIFGIRLSCEVYITLNFVSKPKISMKVYEFKKLFSVLQLLTVGSVVMISSYFFFWGGNFPKNCSIQDNNVGLCSSSIISDKCSINLYSPYYDFFSNPSYCRDGYPSCICSGKLACGPFIGDSTPFISIYRYIAKYDFINFIWKYCFDSSPGTWVIAAIIFIRFNFQTNSFREVKKSKDEKEIQYAAHINFLKKTIQQQHALIQKLNLMEGDASS